MKKISILMIANSFGVNVGHYVHQISMNTKCNITIGILYIGGCSLKMHSDNCDETLKPYLYYENGECVRSEISIAEALKLRKWDYITLQQVSGDSGIYETYFPYLNNVINYVSKFIKKPKFLFHKTWAYRQTNINGSFKNYDNDAEKMHFAIVDTYASLLRNYPFPVIDSGNIVYKLKNNFDIYQNDGYHLNSLGEYAIGLGLVHKVGKIKVIKKLYVPDGLTIDDCQKLESIVSAMI